jgi:hypothetical protein
LPVIGLASLSARRQPKKQMLAGQHLAFLHRKNKKGRREAGLF